MKKKIALLMACVMTLCVAIGGTLAWLTAKTDDVTNVFTPSDIKIGLNETKPENKTAKMVPGYTITKDPKVTVEVGSEDCYIFVKVVENNNTITGLAAVDGIEGSEGKVLLYTVETGDNAWTKLTGVDGVDNVYYQVVAGLADKTNSEDNWSDYVLTDNKVIINQNVTKEMMNTTLTNAQPTLSFMAAAIQLYDTNVNQNAEDNMFTPAEAYANLPTEFKNYPNP